MVGPVDLVTQSFLQQAFATVSKVTGFRCTGYDISTALRSLKSFRSNIRRTEEQILLKMLKCELQEISANSALDKRNLQNLCTQLSQ